ncbi:hypothetical protein AKJ58_01280 [candidate division MSBL1 archaeon SCGC-AAA385D11]|uniref:N-acetyltransferase domain-containing protein n=1 Tax=candidate division MSBL1 archaeon SCGC-AAA385D11 TaxID=1698286 RepID=A0A133VNH5_9EURY|nr:hypothetical protein AKJ58_01280 [candidate division MSBL1 archaeon SCGC-AAA385D11]
MKGRIEQLSEQDRKTIFELINRAAKRYRGAVPEDCWSEPYMPGEELSEEMRKMKFYGLRAQKLLGVVGVQNLSGVTLIRHLYVRPERQGIGTKLLNFALDRAHNEKVLVGTWRDASWAIKFYERNGFLNLGNQSRFLRRYWEIPERQVEESVVLRRRR